MLNISSLENSFEIEAGFSLTFLFAPISLLTFVLVRKNTFPSLQNLRNTKSPQYKTTSLPMQNIVPRKRWWASKWRRSTKLTSPTWQATIPKIEDDEEGFYPIWKSACLNRFQSNTDEASFLSPPIFRCTNELVFLHLQATEIKEKNISFFAV